MPIGATIGAGVLGAGATMFGAGKAADAQTAAAERASQTQLQMFERSREDLMPFIQGGQGTLQALLGLLGVGEGGNPMASPLLKPYDSFQAFSPTMEALEATPGYQFALDQGLRAAQQRLAAGGQGQGGNATRAAADYASGLAQQTFGQMNAKHIQDYLTGFNADAQTKQGIFNMLFSPTQMGAGAAAGAGQQATQVGGQIGQNMIGAGNAQAGAWMAGTGAFNNAAMNIANMYGQQNMLQQLMGGGGGWGGDNKWV